MKAKILASSIDELVKAHHDAFVVELLGAEGSGLSVKRVQELVKMGVLDPQKVSGWMIPGMKNDMDMFVFTRLMSKVIDDTSPETQHELRDWTLDQWKEAIDDNFEKYTVERGPETGTVQFGQIEKPRVPSDSTPHAVPLDPDAAPEWMGNAERHAYYEARTRSGQFARHLGDVISEDLQNLVRETWQEEDIVTEADAELRQERLDQLREATGEALATHQDPEKLAVDMMRITDDWEHNWERIARTEIQAAYNDGRVLDALENYGAETQIARFPEKGACAQCQELLTHSNGVPIVWPIEQLIENGTNVGKPRSAWKASIYPLHPNCRCDTVVVPPGLVVDRDGRMKRPEEMENIDAN